MGRKREHGSDDYDKPFPTRFRNLINENKLTQQMVAERIGVSRQIISFYMSGRNTPPFDTLVKIARSFNVSTDYLLGTADERCLEHINTMFSSLIDEAIVNNVIARCNAKELVGSIVSAYCVTEENAKQILRIVTDRLCSE